MWLCFWRVERVRSRKDDYEAGRGKNGNLRANWIVVVVWTAS